MLCGKDFWNCAIAKNKAPMIRGFFVSDFPFGAGEDLARLIFSSENLVGNHLLWRGSLLPLGGEAAPNPAKFLNITQTR
ncbi:hypothetical protein V466_10700 [Pseudomonas mandelii PD30]|uniref:Uncharacterized protein n=1 Tax=Pseudomonas mandelii PD30 TaxID=1419583 RepID=A0A059L3S4_9PSED|nr:hypothetical protein V466_10700 [Pseudomonas mandelii PD30]